MNFDEWYFKMLETIQNGNKDVIIFDSLTGVGFRNPYPSEHQEPEETPSEQRLKYNAYVKKCYECELKPYSFKKFVEEKLKEEFVDKTTSFDSQKESMKKVLLSLSTGASSFDKFKFYV